MLAPQLQRVQGESRYPLGGERYEKPPPGLIKEDETKPEDCIPDVPGNEHAREFLAHAPTRGLWMPLGKEVKVMQCECGRASSNTPEYTQVTYNLRSALIFELSRSHHSAVQGVV